jgi:hypothetical protein
MTSKIPFTCITEKISNSSNPAHSGSNAFQAPFKVVKSSKVKENQKLLSKKSSNIAGQISSLPAILPSSSVDQRDDENQCVTESYECFCGS